MRDPARIIDPLDGSFDDVAKAMCTSGNAPVFVPKLRAKKPNPTKQDCLNLQITLYSNTSRTFVSECVKRQIKPSDMAKKIISTIVDDELFAAVLDD
jgi:hypothetical protein